MKWEVRKKIIATQSTNSKSPFPNLFEIKNRFKKIFFVDCYKYDQAVLVLNFSLRGNNNSTASIINRLMPVVETILMRKSRKLPTLSHSKKIIKPWCNRVSTKIYTR